MLEAMQPSGAAAEGARWQQQKSARTRSKLVTAAVDCLIEHGYAGLTTQAVAERTGVSRGAMHHHFPSRIDLVAAVVEQVFYERMRLFLEDYLGAASRGAEGELVELAAQAHWRSVQSREYAAYVELAVAARTDAELEQFFGPAARRYDEVWTGEMIESFPQWREQWEAMKLASDFVIAVHMGMLLQRPVMGEARIAAINALAGRTLRELYAARTEKPAGPPEFSP